MRVEQVTFTGFKSLHDLTLPLGDLTVITGPNGAGKSNLLAGLGFLADVYNDGLDKAMESAGGFDRVAYRREQTVSDVKFGLQATLGADEVRSILTVANEGGSVSEPDLFCIDHEFSVTGEDVGGVSSYRRGSDRLRVTDAEGRPWLPPADTGPGAAEILEIVSSGLAISRRRPDPDVKVTSPAGSEELVITIHPAISFPFGAAIVVKEAMGALRVFRLSPPVCRQSGIPGPNVLLGRSGENLPAVAEHLRQHDPDAWTRVQEAMSVVLPGYTDIEIVPTTRRKLTLDFRERGVSRPWTSDEISDGTIQFLALVVALYDRRVPLLAVEEPENALHPWMLREFIKLCHYEKGKQVVLTTHSPALIDYVPSQWVHVMWREDGKSRIGRMVDLDPDIKAILESGKVGLFEMYDAGIIQQATPGF